MPPSKTMILSSLVRGMIIRPFWAGKYPSRFADAEPPEPVCGLDALDDIERVGGGKAELVRPTCRVGEVGGGLQSIVGSRHAIHHQRVGSGERRPFQDRLKRRKLISTIELGRGVRADSGKFLHDVRHGNTPAWRPGCPERVCVPLNHVAGTGISV